MDAATHDTEDYTAEVERIASALNEQHPPARDQIGRMLHRLGSTLVGELLAETLAVEAAGGLRTSNGRRRRTPGGTFFVLARQRLEREQRSDDLRVLFPPREPRHQRARGGFVMPPTPVVPRRPRRRDSDKTRPRRPLALADRRARLEHLRVRNPDQAAIHAALDRHLGAADDLYRRSIDPETGAVTLAFFFPARAQQHYADAIAAAAAEAGVPIQVAAQPHQGRLSAAASAVLPPGLTLLRPPALHIAQQTVRLLVQGAAADDALQAAHAQFAAQTGWSLELDYAPEQASTPTTPQNGPFSQHEAVELVRATLGAACHKVSADTSSHTLTVRFFFPDVAQPQHAATLDDLAQRTGWQIIVPTTTHQGALTKAALHSLPAGLTMHGQASIYPHVRRITIRASGEADPASLDTAVAAVAATTGWTLEIELT